MKPSADPVDRHVGSRVKIRRMLADVSQERLANWLGVTFQQVQKYEKGTNRISASRLQQIGSFLGVPVSFFFEGAPVADLSHGRFSDLASAAFVTDLMATAEGLKFIKAFVRIKSPTVRRQIIATVEAIANGIDK